MIGAKLFMFFSVISVGTIACKSSGEANLFGCNQSLLETKQAIEAGIKPDLKVKASFVEILELQKLTPTMITNECVVKKTGTILEIIQELDDLVEMKFSYLRHFQSEKNGPSSSCSSTFPDCRGEMELHLQAINLQEEKVAKAKDEYEELPKICK